MKNIACQRLPYVGCPRPPAAQHKQLPSTSTACMAWHGMDLVVRFVVVYWNLFCSEFRSPILETPKLSQACLHNSLALHYYHRKQRTRSANDQRCLPPLTVNTDLSLSFLSNRLRFVWLSEVVVSLPANFVPWNACVVCDTVSYAFLVLR